MPKLMVSTRVTKQGRSMNAHTLPVRTSICLLAVLLTLTPISQVLAQTSQQEQQQSQATQSDKQDEETDKAAILRPRATAIFPVADPSAAAFDSVAVVPAAISTAGWVGIGVLIVAVALVVAYLIVCDERTCGSGS